MFISHGANYQVNLPAHVVTDIAQKIGQRDASGTPLPPINVFDEAKNEVVNLMFETFPRFVEVEKNGCLVALLKKGNRNPVSNMEGP
ncbi:hypothetical protein HK104_006510 [Borealophlyctis nickersoniae]|nr:hypothetical protein HK104_006510 [Borealophlyctis nickersoniae]